MKTAQNKWITLLVTLSGIFVLVLISPTAPIDPWNILSPKKVATMILALTFIQVMGSVSAQFLGVRGGTILTGFFAGLISSTATTAALAKKSKSSAQNKTSTEILTFLSATTAMLVEGVSLLLLGTNEIHFSLLVIFLGPILATVVMIIIQSQNLAHQNIRIEITPFRIFPILKLTIFIISILALSKILQKLFGQIGLLVLTFIVSLFEIHSSVISNIQLHDAGFVSVRLLGSLLAIAIIASYLSKIFLIFTIGGNALKSQAVKSTFILFLSLLLSWLLFLSLN
jgi:uncharacterized membrane protein (DUF4010 family)